jgi:hypothetical protein
MSANANGGTPVTGQVVAIPRSTSGAVARQTGTGEEMEYRGETATAAVAERARASVEARFIMARRFPRDMDKVRTSLLKACQNPTFAKVAIYRKPIGEEGIEGPSIRMAEEVARCMGNIATEVDTVYDDVQKCIIAIGATDLESNLTHPLSVLVQKTVERKKPRDGTIIRGQRINSYGDVVYLVEATDDEMLNKTAALVSKALRTCLLRLAPEWLLNEAMKMAYKTRADEDAKDPDEARKTIIDSFMGIGVDPPKLIEYVGHALDSLTPKELNELRGLFVAIRDGEANWAQAIEHARGRRGGDQPPAAGNEPVKTGDPLTDAAAKAKAAREAKTQEKPAAQPPAGLQPRELERDMAIEKARAAGRTTFEWKGKIEKVPPPPDDPNDTGGIT